MSGGLLSLRHAQAHAAKFAPEWAHKSEDTFLRWLKACARDESRLLVRMTPGQTAPYWVRRAVLDRILDAGDRDHDATLADHERRIQELEAGYSALARRLVGLRDMNGHF
jgi:hypothetical protein